MLKRLCLLSLLSISHAYAASSFNEVRNVLVSDPILVDGEATQELKIYQRDKLPAYKVKRKNFFTEVDGKKVNILERDAKRTVSETADYYDRIKKLLHPNGICFTGTWEITQPSKYSGYFEQGKKALMIARASTTMTNTKKWQKRGFGFAGKLFPTEDPEQRVETGNFFAIDILAGSKVKHYLDVGMTNEPKTGFSFAIGTAIAASQALSKADKNPGFRPLYPISELGLKSNQNAVTPKWIMIRAAVNMPRVDEQDFRDELSMEHYSDGLMFDIYVSDTTNDAEAEGWTQLGVIQFNESIVSYGCDRRLHFAHPKIK